MPKTIKSETLREILVRFHIMADLCGDEARDQQVEEFLAEIRQILKECKPEWDDGKRKYRYYGNDHKNGFNLSLREYTANIEKRLG